MDVMNAEDAVNQSVLQNSLEEIIEGGFNPALMTTLTRQKLSKISKLTPPAAVLFTSKVEDLAPGSARILASRWVRSSEARKIDIRHLYPVSDRWSVGEIEEEILAPAHLFPIERHVFIVERADAMEARCFDRLLKAIEEPPSLTTFVLCATDIDEIPATIRGRVEHQIELEAASEEIRVDALTSDVITRAAAQIAVELAGPAISLAVLLASHPELTSVAERVLKSPSWSYTKTPANDAVAIVNDAALLAASWYQGKPVNRTPEKLSPVERARMRQLLGLCFDRHKSETSTILTRLATEAGGSLKIEGKFISTQAVESRLRAVDEAQRQLRSFTSPKLVIAALLGA